MNPDRRRRARRTTVVERRRRGASRRSSSRERGRSHACEPVRGGLPAKGPGAHSVRDETGEAEEQMERWRPAQPSLRLHAEVRLRGLPARACVCVYVHTAALAADGVAVLVDVGVHRSCILQQWYQVSFSWFYCLTCLYFGINIDK